jgi:tetratricopeptide (TPR) repeat protein
MKGYTTREVAEVLGLPTSQILSWTRGGLLTPQRGPRGAYLYSFQDIVLLRTARALLDEKLPARKVKAALEALREQLPVGRPLTAVHISALGDRILVRDEETTWEPDSGQIQMDFSVAEIAERAEPIARRSFDRTADPTMSADDWFDTGVDLEAVASDRAAEAYRRALSIDATHTDALVNLGRLLHEEGDLEGAEEMYRAAATAEPGAARPLYNLGVVLGDRGQATDAVVAYRRALQLDPGLAAAHYNLSRLLQARGDRPGAIRHLTEYKRLVKLGDVGG